MKKVSTKTTRKTKAARPESYRKQLETLLRRLVIETRTADERKRSAPKNDPA